MSPAATPRSRPATPTAPSKRPARRPTPDTVVVALAPAAAADLAATVPGQARALLAEPSSNRRPRVQNPDHPRQLASMVRTALAAADPALAKRPTESARAHPPAPQVRALRRPRRSSPNTPATTQKRRPSTPKRPRAGESSGTSPNRAYALLGQGRCLLALDDPPPQERSAQARELFASMGDRPALCRHREPARADDRRRLVEQSRFLLQAPEDRSMSAGRSLRVAVVGSWSVGFFADGRAARIRRGGGRGDLGRLPTPWGLSASGLPPDHPELKTALRAPSSGRLEAGLSLPRQRRDWPRPQP